MSRMFGIKLISLLFSLTWFSVSGLQLFNESAGVSDGNVWSCLPWLQPGNTSAGEPSCVCPVENWKDILIYDDVRQQWLLAIGYCMTYSNSTLFLVSCPYDYSPVNDSKYVTLPLNGSALDSLFCASQNRQGVLCEECAEGFGVPLLTATYRCENCTEGYRGLVKYLALQFIPITVLFLFFVLTQISVTKPPLSSFVLYCQFVALAYNLSDVSARVLFEENAAVWTVTRVMLTLYGVWNLDFGIYLIKPFCVSSSIGSFQSLALEFVSPFFSIVLIIITYSAIELHSHNFRPLVWLWRPFNKYFARFRKSWNPRASVIDVFATFLFLSYTKLLTVSAFLLQRVTVFNMTAHPSVVEVVAYFDPSISYFGRRHLPYAVVALLILFTAALLPLLLISHFCCQAVNRCRCCRVCSPRRWQVFHVFIEKFNGYYKDGTVEGSRDYRWVSLQPFAFRTGVFLINNQFNIPHYLVYFFRGLLCLGLALFTAIVQPYKKQYMNTMEALLMANFGLLALLYTALKQFIDFHSLEYMVLSVVFVIVASIPQLVLGLIIFYKLCKSCFRKRAAVDTEELECSTQLLPDRLINEMGYESLQNVPNRALEM